MASEPAPWQLWLWVGLSGLAIVIMVAGWPGTDRVRRGRTLFAASFALLSVGLTVNAWIGYSPTVYAAWNQLTDGPLPGETDWATMVAMQGGPMPGHGVPCGWTSTPKHRVSSTARNSCTCHLRGSPVCLRHGYRRS